MNFMSGDNIFETVINYVLLAVAIATLYTAVRGLITFLTEKEKAVIASKAALINDLAFVFCFIVLFIIDIKGNFMFGVVAACDLIAMPVTSTTLLTPKGICNKNCLKQTYVPVADVSYQYKDEKLELHYPKKNKTENYQYGIKKTGTVTMLADWYPKYEYTNPIVPEDDNDDTTETDNNDNEGV